MAGGNLKMCQACRGLIAADSTTCPLCGIESHYAARRSGGGGDSAALTDNWPVTTLLLVVNALIFVATIVFTIKASGQSLESGGYDFFSPGDDALDNFGAIYRQGLERKQYWRLITWNFLHGGILHIALNSFGLIQIGRMAEEIYGSAKYFCLYLVSGIVGALVVVASNSAAVGASGALYGLTGALFVFGYKHGGEFGRSLKTMMFQWLMYGLLISFMPNISMAGHIGGLIGGAAMAWIIDDVAQTSQSQFRTRMWQVAATVALLVTVGSFVMAARYTRTETSLRRVMYFSEQMFQAMYDYQRWNKLEKDETPNNYLGSFSSAVTKLENTDAVDAESQALKQQFLSLLSVRRDELQKEKGKPLKAPDDAQRLMMKESFDQFYDWLRRQAAAYKRPVDTLHDWKLTSETEQQEKPKAESQSPPKQP